MRGKPKWSQLGFETRLRLWLLLWIWWINMYSAPLSIVSLKASDLSSTGIAANAFNALTTPMWQEWLSKTPPYNSVIWPTFRRTLYLIIKSLISGDPVYSTFNSRVFSISELDQAPNHVAWQAWNNGAMPAPTSSCTSIHRKAATFVVLRTWRDMAFWV
jgi:hypothetical protein